MQMSRQQLLASVSPVAMAKQLIIRQWDEMQAAEETRRRLALEAARKIDPEAYVVQGEPDESR